MKSENKTYWFLILSFAIIISMGMSGCMGNQKKYAEINEKTRLAMMDYLEDKYDQPFTEVEFIPAWRGFNDGMNKSMLVAKSSEGFLVNVWERVGKPGVFWDNYAYVALPSWCIDADFDYSNVAGLSYAKTYIYLKEELDSYQLNELRETGVDFLADKEGDIESIIAIKTSLSESDLESVYGIYKQLETKNREFRLCVAFSAFGEKSEQYVNNNQLFGIKKWEEFDSNVSHTAWIYDANLSFEEFSEQIINWRDTQ